MVSWWAGDRTSSTDFNFLDDLQSRLANRLQLTTDGHGAYLDAVGFTFGDNLDFAPDKRIQQEIRKPLPLAGLVFHFL